MIFAQGATGSASVRANRSVHIFASKKGVNRARERVPGEVIGFVLDWSSGDSCAQMRNQGLAEKCRLVA